MWLSIYKPYDSVILCYFKYPMDFRIIELTNNILIICEKVTFNITNIVRSHIWM